jgi:hypothetical protein
MCLNFEEYLDYFLENKRITFSFKESNNFFIHEVEIGFKGTIDGKYELIH